MSPNRFLIRLFSGITITTCLAFQAWSQSPSSSGKDAQITDLVLKKTVRRVIVDVVVTDSTAKPVAGLTANDFSVTEDGKPQQILTFDKHTLDTQPDAIPKLPPLPVN